MTCAELAGSHTPHTGRQGVPGGVTVALTVILPARPEGQGQWHGLPGLQAGRADEHDLGPEGLRVIER